MSIEAVGQAAPEYSDLPNEASKVPFIDRWFSGFKRRGTGGRAGLASSARDAHGCRWLAAEARRASRARGAGACADVGNALLLKGERGVAKCPASRARAMQCEQIRAA